MGGQEAIGVLLEDGNVCYYLVTGGCIGITDVLEGTTESDIILADHKVPLDRYFSEELFYEEDTNFRYLRLDDNRVVFRCNGSTKEYELTLRVTKNGFKKE